MIRPAFSIFQSHLDLAHTYWETHLKKTSPPYVIVDATCGNGYDTLALAKMALIHTEGALYGIDAQEEAIERTQRRLRSELSAEVMNKISLAHQSHATFPTEIPECDLVVYNLGYLPGGDKTKTTHPSTTLLSLHHALSRMKKGGLISMTCYPGHIEGAEEEEALLEYTSQLPPQEFLVCHHRINNRSQAPSLLLIFKNN